MAHIPDTTANAEAHVPLSEPREEGMEGEGEAEATAAANIKEMDAEPADVSLALEANPPECMDAEVPPDLPDAPDLADGSPRDLESLERAEAEVNFMVPTALHASQSHSSEIKLPVSDAGYSSYSYPQFVERFKDASAQEVVNEVRDFVNQFPANLTRLQAARRIHTFLAEVTPNLLKANAFRNGGNASELANEGLEKFVVLKLYKLLYRHDPADIREDERVEQALRVGAAKGAAAIQATLSKLDAKQIEVFDAAAQELQKVEQYRAPRDKLSCFVNAIRLVESIGTLKGGGQQSSWEQLLVTLILKASAPNLYSNLEFTAAFRHPSRISPDERKALGDLASAFLTAIGGSSRRLASAELAGNAKGQSGDDMPLWLMDAGVTFNFSDRSPDALSIGEVDELLDEYQKMIRAIRDLIGPQQGQKTA